MVTDLEKLKLAANSLICAELPPAQPTQEAIRGCVEQLRPSFPTVTDEEAQALVHELEAIHSVTMKLGACLEGPGHEPWLEEARSGRRRGNGGRRDGAAAQRETGNQAEG